MSTDFNKLIPELPLWNNGDGIDVEGWLSSEGDYEHAIAYAELYWPEFVEHDGCIFRRAPHQKTYQDWIKATNGKKASVEAVMNHMHIIDIFHNVKKAPSKEQIRHLGLKLKDMWEAKLKHDFPDRDITVFFSEQDPHDLLDYYITIFQSRTEDA